MSVSVSNTKVIPYCPEKTGDMIDNDFGTAICIDKGMISTLFTKYGSVSTRGMGFGLYLAKKIIEAHGGMLWTQNKAGNYGENGNGGPTFSSSLPVN